MSIRDGSGRPPQIRQLGDVRRDPPRLVVNLSVHLLIPAPISPREMMEIEQFVRRVAGWLGGSCHAWGDARSDRALACVDCYARFARARFGYQSHTMRALRAMA